MIEGKEEKSGLKRRLFEACLENQRGKVQTAREAMREAQENANTDDVSAEESFDSYREQLQHTRDMYALQMQNSINDLEILERIPAYDVTPVIEPGAVVWTNVQNFFIAISLGKIDLDDKSYLTISTSAPIFQAMVGLKKGDSFKFRDKQFIIHEVF